MHDFSTIVALGDPQTTLSRVQAVLARHGLLTAERRLREDVHLVVLGDYFDFGKADERFFSGREGLSVLRYFADHPEDQVTLILGNHDLARVGEFVTMTDERFSEAVVEATTLYGAAQSITEEAFLERYPEFPSLEVVARDFSAYLVEQRDLVMDLVDRGRLVLAAAFGDLLFCHAGVTRGDLQGLGLEDAEITAETAANALNQAFHAAWKSWPRDVPFVIPGLHVPGSAVSGEGGGILFHRASDPILSAEQFEGPHRRRYDPRDIPRGVLEVVGHVRDAKSRNLMPHWTKDEPPEREGALRGLTTDGESVAYRMGVPRLGPNEGGIVFLDGGMHHVPAQDYEIFDAKTRSAYAP